MNWLAHVLLCENHIENQLGNLLTDPLKAKAWNGASERIYRGIETHITIDTFTDSHDIVKKSKALITPRGHLKGVVLDILYDHFLSLHWNTFCSIPKEKFLEDFRSHALISIGDYPDKAQEIISKVVSNRQLSSYEHMDGVIAAFGRIDNRLSTRAKRKDTCMRYIPLIDKVKDELEENFLQFFPELMDAVKPMCKSEGVSHWKFNSNN
jgi:acyl carrier protein phosphodiesterase